MKLMEKPCRDYVQWPESSLTLRALGSIYVSFSCSPPDIYHHSAWRHSGQRAAGRHEKPQNKAESPASHCTPLRCRNLGAGGTKAARMLWQSCCHQHPPTPATHYSSTTGGPDLEVKPRITAGEGQTQRQENQGLFSHAAV